MTIKYVVSSGLLTTLFSISPVNNAATEIKVEPDQVITALEQTFGIHHGKRRNHIKGSCAIGEFIGNTEIQTYSRSTLFSGQPVPVVARFSLPGGNPQISDTSKTPRGLALEFKLPEEEIQHMTMLNTPIFGAAKPETFFDHIIAKKPEKTTGKLNQEKVKQFKRTHPDAHAQGEFLATHNPPASWTNSAYFGIHTFKFVDDKDQVTLIKWHFTPHDGEKELTEKELKTLPNNFLEQRLIERSQQGPILWDFIVTIGQNDDPQNDPTLTWPQDRQQIKAGTLKITSAYPQQGAECETINYDPLFLADGIEATNDPVLLFRSPAYAISFSKRTLGE